MVPAQGKISQMMITTKNSVAELLWVQDKEGLKILSAVSGEVVKMFPTEGCEEPNGKYGPVFIPGYHKRLVFILFHLSSIFSSIPLVVSPCIVKEGIQLLEIQWGELKFEIFEKKLIKSEAKTHSVSSPVMDLCTFFVRFLCLFFTLVYS